VILDFSLPGRDGLEVLRDLRGAGFDRPILLVTARDAIDAVEPARAAKKK
jgi:DNA-binding response OmpR family regulator